MRRIFIVLLLCALTGALRAEPLDLPIWEVLELGTHAYASADGFEDRLDAVLPDLRIDPSDALSTNEDPFRWALAGSFGGEGASPVPGAIFGCARYGLVTRDLFAERGFVHPETFPLMGQLLPLHDDVEVWPEAAVARLHCIFIWDDAQTVRILSEDRARAGLLSRFEEVTSDSGTTFAPLLGDDGFRLFGRNGPVDTVVWLESGDVILTNGHQQVSFRAFLIGGAV
jgi:hypothetical protein